MVVVVGGWRFEACKSGEGCTVALALLLYEVVVCGGGGMMMMMSPEV